MNNKRSMWKLFFSGASLALLVTNCTIKSESDTSGNSCTTGDKTSGCLCSNNATGYQVCKSSGVYGSCVCPDGTVSIGGGSNGDAGSSSSNGGGTAYAGGTSYSGGSNTEGGATAEAGSGGEAGALVIDPADCSGCLVQNCAREWDDCTAEDEDHAIDPTQYCFGSDKKPGTGQMELILDCITGARAKGIANRVAVRACGASIGTSDDPADNPAFTSWPPPQMSPATEELMNCMADLPDPPMPMPGAWATDPANFPDGAPPKPWDDGTCAKLACTSKLPTP